MIYKTGIIGATGKLGKALGKELLKDPSFVLQAPISHSKSPSLHLDYGDLLGSGPLGLKVRSCPPEEPLDLLFDVSQAQLLERNLSLALHQKTPLVIGTTGLSQGALSILEKAAMVIPIFYSPNFSLGMALLHALTEKALSTLSDPTIVLKETHHTQKKDNPSGSLLSLLRLIQKNSPEISPKIESHRIGDVVGDHEVLFEGLEESFSLKHSVKSRRAFATGALLAAKFLLTKKVGLYTMSDLLCEQSK